VRTQGVYVSDDEIERLVSHWQAISSEFEPISTPWDTLIAKHALLDETDQLLEQAIEIAQKQDFLSTSLLQRRLRIGFPRAARIMEHLYEMGLVEDPKTGGKTRKRNGVFYPAGMGQKQFLAYYSQRFNAVEMDSTFYGVPTAEAVQRWTAVTTPAFKISPKTPREITHDLRLGGSAALMAAFLETMRLLGDKLGPILIQFPPDFTIGAAERLDDAFLAPAANRPALRRRVPPQLLGYAGNGRSPPRPQRRLGHGRLHPPAATDHRPHRPISSICASSGRTASFPVRIEKWWTKRPFSTTGAMKSNPTWKRSTPSTPTSTTTMPVIPRPPPTNSSRSLA
jgi:hypothetical protein